MPPETTPSNEFEQRIAALVGQKAESDRTTQATQQSLILLQKQNQILEQRLNDVLIGQQPSAPVAPASSGLPSSTPSAPAQTGDIAALVAGIVKDAVGQAVKPLVDARAADSATAALQTKQNLSMSAAVKQYPQLQDPDSILAKTADRIWSSRADLQGLDDAPLVIASLAASALAGSKEQTTQNIPAKRQAATVPGQTSAREHITSILNDSDSGTSKLREGAAEVAAKNEAEGVRGNEDGANRIRDVFRAQLNTIVADNAEAME